MPHAFAAPDGVVDYFTSTAAEHMAALSAVARPDLHLVRGVEIPAAIQDAVLHH